MNVKISENWHINSNKPSDEFLIPTELRIEPSDEYEISRIIYPKPTLKRLAFAEQQLAIFAGDFNIRLEGKILQTADSLVTVKGSLYYQGVMIRFACRRLISLLGWKFRLDRPVSIPSNPR